MVAGEGHPDGIEISISHKGRENYTYESPTVNDDVNLRSAKCYKQNQGE
jgi:hypothetical protein